MTKAKAAKATPASASRSGSEGTGTVQRTIRVIAAVAASKPDVGVGELALKLSLPIPTIHRLLHLLRDNGVVDWNPQTHRYSTGPELYRIAAKVTASADMQKIALGEITKLSQETGETVLFGMYQPSSVAMSFEVRAEGDHPLQYRIQMHEPLSLVWGASGKAILAFLPDDVIEKALERETATAQNGSQPPTYEQLTEELARFRKAGFGVSEGEKLAGARGVAAPVFSLSGIVGSICMTSPKERVPINRIAEIGDMVANAARRLSRSLGALDS